MYATVVLFHVPGATVWVGGHLVLALSVLPRALKARDPQVLLGFESGFERVGIPALVVQVLTGLWLAQHAVPRLANWFDPTNHLSAYHIVLVTLAGVLFVAVGVSIRTALLF